MEVRKYYPAVHLQYSGSPTLTLRFDGGSPLVLPLPPHVHVRHRRLTLPTMQFGVFPQYQYNTTDPAALCQFESLAATAFQEQQLFHYFEFGYRGAVTLACAIDGLGQSQSYSLSTTKLTDTHRLYFNPLAYGFVPHIHNSNSGDGEILWARPMSLPPRFYRGLRTHAEFQIVFSGRVELNWYLDGNRLDHNYVFEDNTGKTMTEKEYFPSGTLGHVLQYVQINNPSEGKIFSVETDVTLADLEQQSMSQQPEG